MSLSIGTLLIIIGLIHALAPAFIWLISIGWNFRDAQPSDFAIKLNRIIGYILITIGGFYILDFFYPGL